MATQSVLFALIAEVDLDLYRMNAKTKFLHDDIDEQICMKKPEGCIVLYKEHLICKLKYRLYAFMLSHEFNLSHANCCLSMKMYIERALLYLFYM